MIIGKDIHPERKLYYLGALIIDILGKTFENEIDFFNLFQKLNEKEKVSIRLFILALDWLFLVKVIKGKGNIIQKCF